jgi:4-hydroxy-tetrahydrodipicolinate synthase
MGLTGLLPVIPTPFRDGAFDPVSFGRMVDRMTGHLDGYTLLGSTGEAPSMTTAERMAIVEQALAMTPAEMTVVVGVTHTSVADSVALARHAEQHGARGVMCAMPYYFANVPDGMLAYLRQIDEAIGIDLVLYDNPVASRTVLAADTVLGWAGALEHLTTVKLTDHDLAKVPRWREAGLSVLAGDDPIIFRYLAAGVDGAMVIVPMLFPAAFRRCFDLVLAGELAEAFRVLSAGVLPFSHVFGIGDEIATTKCILHAIGVFDSDEVRPPLVPATPERRELLVLAYELAARAQQPA